MCELFFFLVANMCVDLLNIDNGRVDRNGRYIGAVAMYRCVTGYILEGNNRRACQIDGKWSGREPSCNSEFTAVECESFLLLIFFLR